jgi:hypothetical protein
LANFISEEIHQIESHLNKSDKLSERPLKFSVVAEKPPISEKKKGLSQAFQQMKMRKMGGS